MMHKRLAFIDTLRGIAVLAVVLQHALEEIVSNQDTGAYYWSIHNAIGHYFTSGDWRRSVLLSALVILQLSQYRDPDSRFHHQPVHRLYPPLLSIAIVLVMAPLLEGRSFRCRRLWPTDHVPDLHERSNMRIVY